MEGHWKFQGGGGGGVKNPNFRSRTGISWEEGVDEKKKTSV